MKNIYITNPAEVLRDTNSRRMVITCDEASDGSHTFDDLYKHRYALFIALCRILSGDDDFQPVCRVWKSKRHADASPMYDGYFIMGIYKEPGRQISYHLPIEYWSAVPLAENLEVAPVWDGHNSFDVIDRLFKFDGQ